MCPPDARHCRRERIHAFAVGHGRRIEAFGSDFLRVPLSQPGEVCMALAMFLPPGRIIGRHEAEMPQLLCAVAGEGVVSGPDGRGRPATIGG